MTLMTLMTSVAVWLLTAGGMILALIGGFVATTGILAVYVARTSLDTSSAGGLAVLTTAGVTSVGWMTVVNFMIRSAFRWALFALSAMWAVGLLVGVAAR